MLRHGMNRAFARCQDDHDGERTPEHHLAVGFSPDGDAWVLGNGRHPSLRFRGPGGEGCSPRVHRALLVLAEAIRRDNEEHPQPPG